MTTLRQVISDEVRRFCEQEGLEGYLALAYDLVEKHFPNAQRIEAEYVEDPESDDAWISLVASVPGTAAEIIAQDDRLLDEWIATVPPSAVLKITLLYVDA